MNVTPRDYEEAIVAAIAAHDFPAVNDLLIGLARIDAERAQALIDTIHLGVEYAKRESA